MANIRATIQSFPEQLPLTDTTYSMQLKFRCMPINLSGEFFDIEIRVTVAEGDGAAVVKNKFLTALATAVNTRQPGDALSVVHGLDLSRWL